MEPGVLSTFASEEPYHCWFAGHGSGMEEDMAEIDRAVRESIEEWRMARRQQGSEEDVEIMSGTGFSEASPALATMLWQQQQQVDCTWPLRFAVLTCCFVSVTDASSKQRRSQTNPNFNARRRYGCTPKARRQAWVRPRVASTYPLCTSTATVIFAWGEHAHWFANFAIQTAPKSSPSTPPTICPPSLPILPVLSTTSAQWLHVYPSVEVKARSRPPRSSRHPLAAINLASPPSTQNVGLRRQASSGNADRLFPEPLRPHPDPSDQNLHNRPPSVSYTIIKRRHVCRHHHQGSPSGH